MDGLTDPLNDEGPYGTVRCALMEDGTCPGLNFYRQMTEKEQASFQALFSAITNDHRLFIDNRERFKQVEGQLWEFKRNGKKKIRLFTFRKGNCWWIVGGIKKKEDDLERGDVDRALEQMTSAMAVLATNHRG